MDGRSFKAEADFRFSGKYLFLRFSKFVTRSSKKIFFLHFLYVFESFIDSLAFPMKFDVFVAQSQNFFLSKEGNVFIFSEK